MITVLLVDDHCLVREAIKSLLQLAPNITVIAEANSGETALELLNTIVPELILMDLNMPGMGGFAAITKILEQYPACKIIVLSAHFYDPLPARLLKAGVKGYLIKGCSFQDMINAITAVHNGKSYLSPQISYQLALHSLSKKKSPLKKLSPQELQVLKMTAQGLDSNEIAILLSILPKTVSSYRRRIYEKLSLSNEVQLTLFAARHNLIDISA